METLRHHPKGRFSALAPLLFDTFSCFTQGPLPYGAQMLMAAGLTGLSPLEIIRCLYYPPIMGLCALLAILTGYPRTTDNKTI